MTTTKTISPKGSKARLRLIELLKQRGTMYRQAPVRLATGEDTHVYLDVKNVVRDGRGLRIATEAMMRWLIKLNLDVQATAIGGPTMGADVLSHTIVLLADFKPGNFVSTLAFPHDLSWFSIRDKVKTDHGMGKRIEGAELGPADKVIITDDVANSGKSLVEAVRFVRDTGATVLAVVPLVDRSDKTASLMEELGVPYYPLVTSEDLGLQPLA